MDFKFFSGCDIAKESFNYCIQSNREILDQGQVENSIKGIRSWISMLKKQYKQDLKLMVFCMEHTGIYSSILLRALHKEELCVCIEGAMNIKLSMGLQRGKNDKVDAQRIAEYAMRFTDQLKQWKPKREVVEKLQFLMSARDRLVKAKKVLTGSNRDSEIFLEKKQAKLILSSAQGSLKAIEKDILKLGLEIKDLIQGDENLQRLVELSTSVPGIGLITSCALIVRTNEFQDYENGKQVACTAGVAPFEHTSGSSIRGKTRVSHRAHKDLKVALHLAAMAAIRTPGELQDFYAKKVADGKNKMATLNAIRNKLIHRVFAVIRDNTMYQKNYQYTLNKS